MHRGCVRAGTSGAQRPAVPASRARERPGRGPVHSAIDGDAAGATLLGPPRPMISAPGG
jgi:hypothetical protein